jgi:hypothetical protein
VSSERLGEGRHPGVAQRVGAQGQRGRVS